MATTIVTKNGSGAPTASDLVAGELAVDLTNKRLYTEDSGGTVLELGTNPASDITFGDNTKAIFGAGSDLQIYHDGSHSYISDQGTGDLRIIAADFRIRNAANDETMIQANSDADVSLWYNNSKKLATTNTGIDVTGSVTATGNVGIGTSSPAEPLHVQEGSSGITQRAGTIALIEGSGNTKVTVASGATSTGELLFGRSGDNDAGRIIYDHNDNSLAFSTNSSERMRIDSAGSVGIGTSSPTGLLHLAADNAHVISKVMASTTGYDAELWLGRNDTRKAIIKAEQLSANSDHDLVFFTNAASADATEKVRITSAGNVGIGRTPIEMLDILSASGDARIRLEAPSGSDTEIKFFNDGAAQYTIGHDDATDNFVIGTANVDAPLVSVTKSGNLLVGKTSTTFSAVGVENRADGRITSTRSGNTNLLLNRLSSDGDIVQFYKDGTAIGVIGSGTGVHFAGASCGLRMHSGGTKIFPTNGSGAALNNTVSIGAEGARWTEVYATNGTINTSDRNEKQDIEELSDAEKRVAVACKGLLRKFRWIDAVEAKGDNARIHFGIIAQDLQSAFEAEGLDAGRYAMFINSTWTDEETGEESSSMGVRYSELLAFIIAAI